MHIHILGICGTFMGGVALLARQMGFEVTGSDAGVYPPMSTQLQAQGIGLHEGYDPAPLDPAPDLVVIGNALSRGNPAVEYLLERGLPYTSGPQFLADYILRDRWVLGVAGTHGKTTTSSMLAWILDYAKLKPGFLIGGIPANFGLSARLGDAPFFVVEADEYDTAFFDKRSKFVHYRARTVVLNNLEFDHADIFEDLAAIKKQFHQMIRTVPANGLIITPDADADLEDVLAQGCWTPLERFDVAATPPQAGLWSAQEVAADGSAFKVYWGEECVGEVAWGLIGRHNVHNALAAVAAARHAGVIASEAVAALNRFEGVKRRMEVFGVANGISVYDDFAHHPTAIATSLDGLRQRVGQEKIIAVLEPRSNTMRMGVHEQTLAAALKEADQVVLFRPADLSWDLQAVASDISNTAMVFDDVRNIVSFIQGYARPGDHVLVMSNGGFDGIHQLLVEALADER